MIRRSMPSAVALFVLAGSAQAQLHAWNNAAGGNWNTAANWSPVSVPNVAGESAVISIPGVYTVLANTGIIIDSLTITNPQATVAIPAQTFTVAAGGFLNDGVVLVNADGNLFNSVLSFSQSTPITGAGEIFLNATTNNDDAIVQSLTGFTLTNPASHLISGSGRIAGSFVNQGDVIGNDILGIGIQLTDTVTQTGAGRLRADGGLILLSSADVSGGRLQGVNGGKVLVQSGTSTLTGVTITGDVTVPGTGGAIASLLGSITNNGVISINPEGLIFNGILRFDSTSAVNGTGQIVMKAVNNTDDAQITAVGFTGTFAAGQTVRGSGRMQGSFVNNGVIRADDATFPLQMFGANITNNGLLSAQNASLTLQNTQISGGTFTTTGTGSILTTSGTSSISGITNSGSMGVSGGGGAILEINGPVINNGTMTINPEDLFFNGILRFQTNTSITGNGNIVLVTNNNPDDAQVLGLGGIGTFGAGQTVRGAGRLSGTFVNNGAFRAEDPTSPLAVNATVTNNGQFAGQDANLTLENATVTGGTFTSTGTGMVRAASGTSTISGVTNTGHLGVNGTGGVFLDLTGPLVNNGTITVNPEGAIFNAQLRFQANTSITGTGSIVLVTNNDTDDAQILGLSATGTFGAGQTVRGAGRLNGTFVNNGTIRADDPSSPLVLNGAITNNGQFEGHDADLTLTNVAVTGGTFASSGTGMVFASGGTSTFGGVTNTGTMGVSGNNPTIVDLATSLINNGTVVINPDANIFNGVLRFTTGTSIDGNGEIILVANNNDDDAQIVNNGPDATLGSGQTIRGSGLLTGNMTVDGTIDPEGSLRAISHNGVSTLTLSGNSTARFDLSGTAANTFDRIKSVSTVSIEGGHCVVTIDPSYTPLPGDSWDIVTGSTVSGRFNSYDLPVSAVAGYSYRVFYQPDRAFVRLTCGSDFDGDGTLNFFDVSGFLADYNAQDPRADVAAPFGVWNFFDISAFLGAYSTGCP